MNKIGFYLRKYLVFLLRPRTGVTSSGMGKEHYAAGGVVRDVSRVGKAEQAEISPRQEK